MYEREISCRISRISLKMSPNISLGGYGFGSLVEVVVFDLPHLQEVHSEAEQIRYQHLYEQLNDLRNLIEPLWAPQIERLVSPFMRVSEDSVYRYLLEVYDCTELYPMMYCCSLYSVVLLLAVGVS